MPDTVYANRLSDEILRELRRPFPPEAIRFKGQSANRERSKALVVPYIDARLVIERLNHVVGGGWEPTYEPLGKSLWCHLTVAGTTRPDIGTGYEGKGLVSDALKRAAVLFGIGVSVYASPSIWLTATGGDKGVTLVVTGQGEQSKVKGIYLTDNGESLARQRYRTWLEEGGIAEFGEPLGHGAVLESAGLESDEQVADGEGGADVAAAPALPLVDVEADTLRQTCRLIYEEVRGLKGGRTKLPPARFQERLAEASTAHDALREYAAELRLLVDELKGTG
jgi:hypothetical protein